MGKRILVSEEQLKNIVEYIKEDTQFVGTDKEKQEVVRDVDENDFQWFLNVLKEVCKKYPHLSVCNCNVNENIITEDITQTLSKYAKGAALAALLITLGVSAPEAMAQAGKPPKHKVSAMTKKFKKAKEMSCRDIGKDKPTASSTTKPSEAGIIYKVEFKDPKFGDKDRGLEDRYFVKMTDGSYKEISAKKAERLDDKTVTKLLKGKELQKAIKDQK
jgi:hypothetical protein